MSPRGRGGGLRGPVRRAQGTGTWRGRRLRAPPADLVILEPRVWSCGCSVTKSCPTLCGPVNDSTPGFSVLLEFAQSHVQRVIDVI